MGLEGRESGTEWEGQEGEGLEPIDFRIDNKGPLAANSRRGSGRNVFTIYH